MVGTPKDEVVVATGGCSGAGGTVNDCDADAPLSTQGAEVDAELCPVAMGATKFGGCMNDAVLDS